MTKSITRALKNIRRMPYQALATIMVLSITFFIANAFVISFFQSQQIIKHLETQPQISAYFQDEAKEEEILRIKQGLETKDYIKSISYISKEEALNIYKEDNQDDPQLLELVTSDMLPASLEIAPVSIDRIKEITSDLESLESVNDVIYREDVTNSLNALKNATNTTGAIWISYLLLTSIFTIMMVIGIKVASRKNEIRIMLLLGAGKWYITAPFLLEGAIYGLLGALIGWGLIYLQLLYTTPQLIEFFSGIPIVSTNTLLMIKILGISLLLGFMVGLLGSIASVRRYFK